MIFEAVILSVIIGFVRKGKLMNFAKLDVKWIYLFMVGAVGQAIVFNMADADSTGWGLFLYNRFIWLHMVTYLLILIPLVMNVNLKGFPVMAIGTVLNFIPIFTNGGKMPVDVPEGYSHIFDMGHTLMTENTNFWFLGDIFFVPPPYPMPKVLSIGDIFLIVGVFWFIQWVMMDEELTHKVFE